MSGNYENYEEVSVIEIEDIDEFVDWVRKQALSFALERIGKSFFKEESKYDGLWEFPEEEDLSSDEVLNEIDKVVVVEDQSKMLILTRDVERALGNVTNLLLQRLLGKLVDIGVLEMCWNPETEDFMWRVPEKDY